jgi:hypothetical protein
MNQILLSAAALGAVAVAGCGDAEIVGGGDKVYVERQQAVSVVPEFSISGAEAIPESLYVTELGLAVTEIRLEPMAGGSSLAYSTREPILVEFDVAGGELVRTEKAVELPEPGKYLVSIRLEPIDREGPGSSSFMMDGFVAGDAALADTGTNSDGRLQPMPFDGGTMTDGMTDRPEYPKQWTSFEYRSKRAVFYTFNDVEFEAGEQFLSFSFDVRDWAFEVVEPISNAVATNETDHESVDVTKQVDSTGTGVEALIETGVVRTDRRKPDGT